MIERKELIEKRKMKNRKSVLIIGAVGAGIIIIALIIVIVVLVTRTETPAVSDTGGRGTVATPENIDEIRASIDEPVQDGYYNTRMNVDWNFQDSKTPSSNAMVENSERNTRTVYFDLFLDETNELIYSSPFIPVGSKLENFALDAEISKGDHTATVVYHLVDDDYQEITTVSVSVNLHILN